MPHAVPAPINAHSLRLPRPAAWRWPLPALLAWALAWAVFALGRALGWPEALALALAGAAGGLLALPAMPAWRRLIVVAGFPLSLLASGGAAALPAWAWLLPLGLLVLAYPLRAWGDAPLFPTPPQALQGLDRVIDLRDGDAVLDAGCGLGHGLQALHALWPRARLAGVEWSWPLAWAAARRCRYARVQRGDLWRGDWSAYRLVYLFQRPESMARALAKARAEMAPGSWLVSLEFEAAGAPAQAVLRGADGRPVWIYRIDAADDAQIRPPAADKPASSPALRGGRRSR